MGFHPSFSSITILVEYATVFVLRPLLAILFVSSLIVFSWYVAWKTVLVHVPLVQEIFGLKKKKVLPKPQTRHRLSRFYNAAAAAAAAASSSDSLGTR